MVKEFIPTLVQTTDYEALRWSDLWDLVSDEFKELAKNGNIDEIYERIKYSIEPQYPEEFVKERIRDFIADCQYASGVVAVRRKLYQEVILAILDEFSDC